MAGLHRGGAVAQRLIRSRQLLHRATPLTSLQMTQLMRMSILTQIRLDSIVLLQNVGINAGGYPPEALMSGQTLTFKWCVENIKHS